MAQLPTSPSYESPKILLTGSNEVREDYATELVRQADELVKKPTDDYSMAGKKPNGASKWNTSAYVANAIATANSLPDSAKSAYAEKLAHAVELYAAAAHSAPVGTQVGREAAQGASFKQEELRIFSQPARQQALGALYEARGNTEPKKYLDLFQDALRRDFREHPAEAAETALRIAVFGQDRKTRGDPISKIAVSLVSEFGNALAVTQPEKAIALADLAVELNAAPTGSWSPLIFRNKTPIDVRRVGDESVTVYKDVPGGASRLQVGESTWNSMQADALFVAVRDVRQAATAEMDKPKPIAPQTAMHQVVVMNARPAEKAGRVLGNGTDG